MAQFVAKNGDQPSISSDPQKSFEKTQKITPKNAVPLDINMRVW
jgi:hypothetical protein